MNLTIPHIYFLDDGWGFKIRENLSPKFKKGIEFIKKSKAWYSPATVFPAQGSRMGSGARILVDFPNLLIF